MKSIAEIRRILKSDQIDIAEKTDLYFLLAARYFTNDNKNCIEQIKNFLKMQKECEISSEKIKLAEKIKEEAEAAGYSDRMVKLYFELGDQYRRNQLETALFFYERALQISTELNSKNLVAESYSNIAYVYNKQSAYEKSLSILEKALKLTDEIQDNKIRSKCFSQIGEIHYYKGAIDQTLHYYLEALKLDEESGDPREISKSFNNIGTVYYRIHDFEKAEEYFSKALEIKLTLPDKAGLAFSYNNLGAINYIQKKYDKALEYYQKSLKIRKKLNDVRGSISCYSNIGGVYFDLDKPEEALNWFNRAYEFSLQLNDKHNAALVVGNISGVYLKIGQYNEAVKSAEIELKLAQELGELPLQNSAYRILFMAYEKKADFKKAFEYHKKFKEISDEIYNNDSEKKISEMKSRFDLEKKEKEAEIYKLKNVELAQANKLVQKKNRELEGYKNHLLLVNQILRHDIANDLSVIKSAARLYKNKSETDMLIEIEKRVNKSLDTINKQRNLENNLISKLRKFNLDEVWKKLVEDHPGIKFVINGSGEIFTDEAIFSVFENLVNNSLLHGKADVIDISVKPVDDHYEIRFADNGIGIPEEIKTKVFEKGFIFGDSGHTGIGLHIVKNTIERYNGKIFVEDNESQGAVFVIKLSKSQS
ncbi:MAG: tetratricopeptide repeat-containing sensor histidine kinase [Candidatus Cloacimonetes bacterium]|nr:tetratricopeptide repeat-containing sensor histidine kinase [Candidatus Cloacimonadota bacterium]MCF7815053.1 tetratricopeptide repeat-containing sensor histidine kinase [Candidatus Cloacimonadota bacterium]MCF7868554.1 tetratricopeptide repeat-containing sensor histidine kinase [Candidatus Cloacimonadota bacterium]MCF7884266.1 tetratricopeptide repeat-containing sensor histidine kinase [Candidatus Cloacimonadota bacterium]